MELFLKDVLISHAIANHFGGAQSVIDLHTELGLDPPRIHKRIDGNNYERQILGIYPHLRVHNVQGGDKFKVDECVITAIETPGHRSDHNSYSLKSKTQNILFPGDMILGSPSVILSSLRKQYRSQ